MIAERSEQNASRRAAPRSAVRKQSKMSANWCDVNPVGSELNVETHVSQSPEEPRKFRSARGRFSRVVMLMLDSPYISRLVLRMREEFRLMLFGNPFSGDGTNEMDGKSSLYFLLCSVLIRGARCVSLCQDLDARLRVF